MSSRRIVTSSLALGVAVAATGWYSALAFPLMQGQAPPRDPVRPPSEIRAVAEKAEKEAALKDRIVKAPTKENYLMLVQYSWERAFRDTSLSESEKADYVAQGIEAVDSALSFDPDYVEALIYKNLLLRTKAQMTPDLVENRLPSPNEQKVLYEFEDRLASFITTNGNALFLARVTHDARREIIWRVHGPEAPHAALNQILVSKNYPREFDYRIESDPEWRKTEWYLKRPWN